MYVLSVCMTCVRPLTHTGLLLGKQYSFVRPLILAERRACLPCCQDTQPAEYDHRAYDGHGHPQQHRLELFERAREQRHRWSIPACACKYVEIVFTCMHAGRVMWVCAYIHASINLVTIEERRRCTRMHAHNLPLWVLPVHRGYTAIVIVYILCTDGGGDVRCLLLHRLLVVERVVSGEQGQDLRRSGVLIHDEETRAPPAARVGLRVCAFLVCATINTLSSTNTAMLCVRNSFARKCAIAILFILSCPHLRVCMRVCVFAVDLYDITLH